MVQKAKILNDFIFFSFLLFIPNRVAECVSHRIQMATMWAAELASYRYDQPATFHYHNEDQQDAVLSCHNSLLIHRQ